MTQVGYQQQVKALEPWFHNLHLPDGTQTAPDHPLGDFPACKWQEIGAQLPASLQGWTALDVGCNAGFYSFEVARRGATVTAIDSNAHYLRQARWAAGQYGLSERITFRQDQIYLLGRDTASYDLVLFLGVFYHLRYPLLALDIISRKVGRLLCMQSLSLPGIEVHPGQEDQSLGDRRAMLDQAWPRIAFVEHRLAGDPTVWWVPNRACLEAMLRDCGMRLIARPGQETYVCVPDPVIGKRVRDRDREEYETALGLKPTARDGSGYEPQAGS